eukprot:9082266-Karenia_brevis.AAC.1
MKNHRRRETLERLTCKECLDRRECAGCGGRLHTRHWARDEKNKCYRESSHLQRLQTKGMHAERSNAKVLHVCCAQNRKIQQSIQ